MKLSINSDIVKRAEQTLEQGVDTFPVSIPLTEGIEAILSDNNADLATFQTINFGGKTFFVGMPKQQAGA